MSTLMENTDNPVRTSITLTEDAASEIRKLAADLTSKNRGKRVQLSEAIIIAVNAYRTLEKGE